MRKVLLVDDTRTVLMTEKMMLSGQGYTIATASNGVEALERVAAEKPDLILLDIMMPQMNGIECCRQVKSTEGTKDIAIIMVTTKGEPEMVSDSFEAGCDDYITKPINKLELLAKVRNYLM